MILLVFPIRDKEELDKATKSIELVIPTLRQTSSTLFLVENPDIYVEARNRLQDIQADMNAEFDTRYLVEYVNENTWVDKMYQVMKRTADTYVYIWNRQELKENSIKNLMEIYLDHRHAGLVQTKTDEWLGKGNKYDNKSIRLGKRNLIDYSSKDGGFMTKMDHLFDVKLEANNLKKFGLDLRELGYQNFMTKN